jgi:hypothetical protein
LDSSLFFTAALNKTFFPDLLALATYDKMTEICLLSVAKARKAGIILARNCGSFWRETLTLLKVALT